jgi:hypothetical protein
LCSGIEVGREPQQIGSRLRQYVGQTGQNGTQQRRLWRESLLLREFESLEECLRYFSVDRNETSLKECLGVNATLAWYDEIKDYDFSNAGFSSETGDFTQVVWKGTENVGFGFAFTSNRKNVYVVAQYTPAGNVEDNFEKNVLPEGC